MVSVIASSVVDRGFIGSVMVNVIASSVVGRGFIGGVMVRSWVQRDRLECSRSWVHRWCNG